MVICLFLGELISIILTVWRSEFGIPSYDTGLKIAPDMTLVSPVITQFGMDRTNFLSEGEYRRYYKMKLQEIIILKPRPQFAIHGLFFI